MDQVLNLSANMSLFFTHISNPDFSLLKKLIFLVSLLSSFCKCEKNTSSFENYSKSFHFDFLQKQLVLEKSFLRVSYCA